MALDWYSDPKATAAPEWSKQDLKQVITFFRLSITFPLMNIQASTHLNHGKPYSPPP